ncbi:MAG: hypothetical protein FJ098_04595 [Deltaproteobacteria bacterium]|nr:hypothetical protein [Deltaproteobacteria bacterium]
MGNIILPGDPRFGATPTGPREEAPPRDMPVLASHEVSISIPPALQEDLRMNQHLAREFMQRLTQAIATSMQDPRTRPRLIGSDIGAVLKERMAIVCKAAIILRRDLGYTLQQTMDELPGQFMTSLIEGRSLLDILEERTQKGRWQDPETQNKPVLRAVDQEDMHEVQPESLGNLDADLGDVRSIGNVPDDDDSKAE